MKYGIGIDISKGKSTIAILSIEGEVIKEPFEFYHNQKDLDNLFKLMREYCKEDIVLVGFYNPFQEASEDVLDVFEYLNKKYRDVCLEYDVIYVDISDINYISEDSLKKIGNRENRWMSDVNHCLSKTLVSQASPQTLFVVEDLTGIRQQSGRQAQTRRELHSWSFFELEQALRYKATLAGHLVITVSARYTSQRCPKCGLIDKTQRDHKLHAYRCLACGYQSNDDRLAAMNLVTLGQHYLSGSSNPRFTKEVIG